MTLATLCKKIMQNGLKADIITMTTGRPGDTRPAIRVHHDYTGPYPTSDAMQQHARAAAIAAKAGYHAEARGHGVATWIY